MKKPFNLRVTTLFAAALALGIVFSAILSYFGLSGIYIFIPVAVMFAACVPVAIVKRGASKPLIFIFATVFFLTGALYMYAKYVSFCQTDAPVGELVELSGRVVETGFTESGRRFLVLKDVTAYDTPISGKVVAYLSETAGDYCRRGYTVTFSAALEKQSYISFGEISYRATQNVKYCCNVAGGMQSKYHFSPFGAINFAIESALFNNLDKETAAVCFAMLTGNTDAVSSGTLQSFRNGGVAHVFAVSGLHIGVLFGGLTFICKKTCVNKYLSTAFRIVLIVLYAGVCNFSPSSVRAVVMCSVAALSSCFDCKYDGLNALSLAAVLLLLINPLYLFEAGFVLSFSAMLGIIFISPNLKRLFAFLPKKINRALSVSLSAQFATIPSMLTVFGNISAAGILLNIIFVPLISVLYVILFISVIIGAVIPAFAQTVLPLACVPLQSVINFIVTCGFEKAIISGDFSNWIFVPFIATGLALSDKINYNRKLLTRGASVCASALIILSSTINPSYAAVTVTFNSGYSGGSVLINTVSGKVLIVTENYGERNDYSASDINSLVVLGGEDNLSVMLSMGGGFEQVYVRGSAIQIPEVGPTHVTYADSFTTCGVKFQFEGSVLFAETCGAKIAVIREDGGEIYGGLLQNTDANLYCYGNGSAILFTDNESYGLSACGEISYRISYGHFYLSDIIPKE